MYGKLKLFKGKISKDYEKFIQKITALFFSDGLWKYKNNCEKDTQFVMYIVFYGRHCFGAPCNIINWDRTTIIVVCF